MQVFFLAESADTPGWGPKYYTTTPSSLSRGNLKKIFFKFFFLKVLTMAGGCAIIASRGEGNESF
jgi:hypothetical protein